MHVTNGKILLNARYMNINGNDCFVNMENVVNGDLEDGYWTDAWAAPTSGVEQKIFYGQKCISNKSLAIQNIYGCICPISNINLPNSTDFTIAHWEKFKSIDSRNDYTVGIIFYTFPHYYPGIHQFQIQPNEPTKKFYYEVTNGVLPIDFSLESDTWYHIMCTKKGNMSYCFINGELIYSITITDTITNNLPYNIYLRGSRSISEYDDIVAIQGECLATESFPLPTTYLLDKKYNTELTYNNIIYPYTKAERKAILPQSIPIHEIDTNILKVY